MTETTGIAVRLNELLADLPAKQRIHELAKRAGVTSKRLLAVLTEIGSPAGSAQASIDATTARAALSALFPTELEQPSVHPTEHPAQPQAEPPTERPRVTAEPWAPTFLAAVQAPPSGVPEPIVNERLATALAGLPARSRVHELAKRAGISAREMIATLADRGVEVKSANSVIAKQVGEEALMALLGTDSSTAAANSSATVDQAPEGGSPDTAVDPTAEEAGRRRRRGRRGRGRNTDRDTAEQLDETADAPTGGAPGAEDSAIAAVAPATADDQADEPDDAADEDDEPAGESASGGSRRRRGGRRQGGNRPGTAVAEAGTSAGAQSDTDAAEATDEVTEDEDGESDSSTGSSARRRRRRRRGGAGEDPNRPDDPADTVVHVRETKPVPSAESQVQGVRGSTRLEAKRQRRRDSLQTRRRPQILTEAEFLARRESVNRVMAVRQRGDLAQVALLEDGVLVEHFVSRAGTASMIGNVYLGRVQNVLPSMEAAFVDIGRGRNAVLYAGEVNWDAAGLAGKSRKIETALSSGDTLLVQVSKDPVGHKGSRLTTQISLPGRFLVYVPAGGATGISRKLPDTERRRLKAILDRIVPADAGVIIRTAAEGVSEEELARDVERLQEQWAEITRQAQKKASAPQQLYAEPDTLLKVVRDLFNSDISQLIIDGDDSWDSLSSYVSEVAPELADRVVRFEGATDVFAAHRIDEQIAKALERKVYLPSGGSLVIDRTEAMTVIDVNTGKYTGSGGNLEETVTKNNLEAAEEVVRQLRLRDIGGIIVIDFIDMVLEANRDLVLRRLTECLGRDRTRHQVAEVTSLGLVQMTRKKMGTGLVEAFSEPCEHCHGRGIILRDVPVDAGLGDTGDRFGGSDRGGSDRGGSERGGSERGGVARGLEDRGAAGRRRRGRDGARELPAAEVEVDVTAAQPQVPAPRRDPRGPKPPMFAESDSVIAAGTGTGTDTDMDMDMDTDTETDTGFSPVDLSSELVAELNGLVVEAPVGDETGPYPEVELESLLPAPSSDTDEHEGGQDRQGSRRGRRRGGRGRDRRDALDGAADAAEEDGDLDGSGVTDDSVDGSSPEDQADQVELPHSEDLGHPAADQNNGQDNGGQEIAPELPLAVVIEPVAAAVVSGPAAPRRRRSASRPAGPPQV